MACLGVSVRMIGLAIMVVGLLPSSSMAISVPSRYLPSLSLSDWTTGTATYFGGPQDGADVITNASKPSGSCGFGPLDTRLWPFSGVVSVSPNSVIATARPASGCNTCLAIKCVDSKPKAGISSHGEPVTIMAVVFDSCPTCGNTTLNLHAFAFEEIARSRFGAVQVAYKQVPCDPPEGIYVTVDAWRPNQGSWLRIVLTNVAGDGGITAVSIRPSQKPLPDTTVPTNVDTADITILHGHQMGAVVDKPATSSATASASVGPVTLPTDVAQGGAGAGSTTSSSAATTQVPGHSADGPHAATILTSTGATTKASAIKAAAVVDAEAHVSADAAVDLAAAPVHQIPTVTVRAASNQEDSGRGWIRMANAFGAAWEVSNLPTQAPYGYDLQIHDVVGNHVIIRNAIPAFVNSDQALRTYTFSDQLNSTTTLSALLADNANARKAASPAAATPAAAGSLRRHLGQTKPPCNDTPANPPPCPAQSPPPSPDPPCPAQSPPPSPATPPVRARLVIPEDAIRAGPNGTAGTPPDAAPGHSLIDWTALQDRVFVGAAPGVGSGSWVPDLVFLALSLPPSPLPVSSPPSPSPARSPSPPRSARSPPPSVSARNPPRPPRPPRPARPSFPFPLTAPSSPSWSDMPEEPDHPVPCQKTHAPSPPSPAPPMPHKRDPLIIPEDVVKAGANGTAGGKQTDAAPGHTTIDYDALHNKVAVGTVPGAAGGGAWVPSLSGAPIKPKAPPPAPR